MGFCFAYLGEHGIELVEIIFDAKAETSFFIVKLFQVFILLY